MGAGSASSRVDLASETIGAAANILGDSFTTEANGATSSSKRKSTEEKMESRKSDVEREQV